MRKANGRALWVGHRLLRSSVNCCWDLWPDAIYPTTKPILPENLAQVIDTLLPQLPCKAAAALQVELIPNLPWCHTHWAQFEMHIRNLSLHVDIIFYQYYPLGGRGDLIEARSGIVPFGEGAKVLVCFNLLRAYMMQVSWL